MKEYKVENHALSYLPEGCKWEYIWGDEFDGPELNTDKWDYRTHMMHKRHPGWEMEGISFDGNSNIVFTVFEKDGKICSTQLQTEYNFMDSPIEDDQETVGDFGKNTRFDIYFPNCCNSRLNCSNGKINCVYL